MARQADAQDRRATRIRLTPSGGRALEQIMRARREWFDHLLEGWEEGDLAIFATMLERFAVALEQDLEERERRGGMLTSLVRRYIGRYSRQVCLVVVLLAVQALANLYLPNLTADIINNGIEKGDVHYIWTTGAFMLADHARRRGDGDGGGLFRLEGLDGHRP